MIYNFRSYFVETDQYKVDDPNITKQATDGPEYIYGDISKKISEGGLKWNKK